VFFVDDHHAGSVQRQEYRRARSDQQPGPAFARGLPGGQPRALGQAGMVNVRACTEPGLDPAHELRCESDFRHKHQHLSVGGEHVAGAVQVDLGLAAAGHAGKQQHFETATCAEDGGRGVALFRVQRGAGQGVGQWRRAGLDPALAKHPGQRSRVGACGEQLGSGARAFGQQSGDLALAWGAGQRLGADLARHTQPATVRSTPQPA